MNDAGQALCYRNEQAYRTRLLGAFALEDRAGADLTPAGRKDRALLAHLAFRGRAVDRDRLAGLLWSERGEAQARASLRQCLVQLKPVAGAEAPLLIVDRQRIALDRALHHRRRGIEAAAEACDATALTRLLDGATTLIAASINHDHDLSVSEGRKHSVDKRLVEGVPVDGLTGLGFLQREQLFLLDPDFAREVHDHCHHAIDARFGKELRFTIGAIDALRRVFRALAIVVAHCFQAPKPNHMTPSASRPVVSAPTAWAASSVAALATASSP